MAAAFKPAVIHAKPAKVLASKPMPEWATKMLALRGPAKTKKAKPSYMVAAEALLLTGFCPTGKGGGQDNSCGKGASAAGDQAPSTSGDKVSIHGQNAETLARDLHDIAKSPASNPDLSKQLLSFANAAKAGPVDKAEAKSIQAKLNANYQKLRGMSIPENHPHYALMQALGAASMTLGKYTESVDAHETEAATSKILDIVVIETGMSKNGREYPPETLKASVPLFEDLNVYMHTFDQELHDHLPDEVRQKFPNGVAGSLVGYLKNARYEESDGKGAIVADFHCVDPRLCDIFTNLIEAKRLDKLGFSIDVEGTVTEGQPIHGVPTKRVDSIDRAYALDVVTYPAAGGRVRRLKASEDGQVVTP